MSLKHLADNIAAHGRHGDDTLIHVDKGELAALKTLAAKHGKPLTTNPDTGLPEAFGLRQLLPMAAGALLAGPVGMSAVNAGLVVGGVSALASGNLKQGMMDGLGAWGGAGLAQGVTAAGAQEVAGQKVAEEAAKNQAENAIAQQTAAAEAANATQMANLGAPGVYTTAPDAAALTGDAATDMAMGQAAGTQPTSLYSATANAEQLAAVKANTPGTELFTKGLGSLGTEAGRNAAYAGVGNGWGLTKYGLAAAAPSIYESMQPKPYEQPNIQGDSNMGPRYLFNSGYSNDIPGRTGPASYQRLSPEEAKKYYGFAEGGEVQYPYGEPVVRMNDGGSTEDKQSAAIQAVLSGPTGAMQRMAQNVRLGGQGLPNMMRQNAGEDAGQQYSYDSENEQYVRRMADGGAAVAGGVAGTGMGDAGDYTGYGPSSSQGQITPGYETTGYAPVSYGLDSSGYTAPISRGVAVPRTMPSMPKVADNTAMKGVRYDPTSRTYVGKATDANYIGGGEYGKSVAELQAELDAERAKNQASQATTNDTWVAKGGLAPDFKRMATGGGISTLGGYSDGGRLLKGPGDGMSDNIPAQIGAKQPARLADGEFVVPADVVSHLGNGSTDAGAKQLYKMMDRIRAARTGRKAQGKQINPNKFTPA